MVKQTIVVRKDLGMRKGKIAAQVAHAAMRVFLDRATYEQDHLAEGMWVPLTGAMREWLDGLYTKIVVSVDSEADLIRVYDAAVAAGIPAAMVVDAGRTEFHGVATRTCVAVGPADAEAVDAVTGGLALL